MRATLRALATTVVVGMLAACSDVGPTELGDDPLEAQQTQANLDALNGVFETEIWSSFGVLGDLFPLGSGAASLALSVEGAAATVEAGSREALQRYAREMTLHLSRSVPRIPSEVRGITFVIDPQTGRYTPSDREGAPANGIRLILYAVNPVTREPVLDREIGHADFIDLGDDLPNGVSLRFIVVTGDVTHLDYTVTAEHADAAGALDIAGFVRTDRGVLTFEIVVAGAREGETATTAVDFVLEMEERNFRAAAALRTRDGPDGHSWSVELEARIGAHVIRVVAAGTRETVEAVITVDDRPFATVSGNREEPVITGPEGRDLSEEERRVLRHILQLQDRVFRMFEHLMRPVGRILNFRLP